MAKEMIFSMLLVCTCASFFTQATTTDDTNVMNKLKPEILLSIGGSAATCEKPKEKSGFRLQNCYAVGSDDFPAARASCGCVDCALKVTMTCHVDGKWYMDRLGVCEQSHCKVCNSSDVPENVKCEVTKTAGHVGEARRCTCRQNCLDVALLCDRAGDWAFREEWESRAKGSCGGTAAGCDAASLTCKAYGSLYHRNQCQQTTGAAICAITTYDKQVSPSMNVSLLPNFSYKFTCRAGFKLKTEQQDTGVQCVNGSLIGQIPECVSEDKGGLSDPMLALVITLSSLLFVSLLVIVVGGSVWCFKYGCHGRRDEQLRSNSTSEPNEYQLRKADKQVGQYQADDDEEPEYDDVGC